MATKIKKQFMFREFLYKDKETRGSNYLKYHKMVKKSVVDEHDINNSILDFLVWAYDLEFFTTRYACKDLKMRQSNYYERVIMIALRKGLIYHYFKRMDSFKTFEDAQFREDGGHSYRVRYALTQRGRMVVKKFYDRLQKGE